MTAETTTETTAKTTATTTAMSVEAIPADELEHVRRSGRDSSGTRPQAWPSPAGVPLRCCLRRATPADDVVLISYAPLAVASPWREVGPVFVHAERCSGYRGQAELPSGLRTGPRVLRGYRSDGSLDYDAICVVPDGVDLEADVRALLARPGVVELHVRATAEQCFTYRVRRGDPV